MKAYSYTKKLESSLLKLTRHIDDMTVTERELLYGIGEFMVKTNKVTFRQLQVLGKLYKSYVNDGCYVFHDWLIWR